MNSLWVEIPDYPNYRISPEGNILSLNYNGTKKSKLIKFGDSRGYSNVTLYRDKNPKTLKPHRLVAAIFVPNPEKKPEVNHKDGDKLNNDFRNLEWVTSSENTIHSFKVLKNKSLRGSKHQNSKLTEKEVLDICSMIENNTPYKLIASRYSISKATVTNIKKGLVWGHITGRSKK